jgi:hypothetical protein
MMVSNQNTINKLEKKLDSFDLTIRQTALQELMALVNDNDNHLPPEKEIANLHCHTFFSYNTFGFSPTHIAWLGKKMGIKFMGIVDFDVLDGVDEFLEACRITGICGSAGMETRAYIPEFSSRVINSPGEPGISYHMGIGFSSNKTNPAIKDDLSNIRNRVHQRNRNLFERVKRYLMPLDLDYERDVVPLTPAGNVTERHMVTIIFEKSLQETKNPNAYWGEKLNLNEHDIHEKMKDTHAFKNLLRKKLMKRGSIGYVQPTIDTFPLIDEVNQLIQDCCALPCITWLDGTSEGEQAIDELLELMIEKGAAALNIIPDRNWNINDPEIKHIKLNNLYQIIKYAKQADLPIIVGTEMNSDGQVMVDNFDAPELESVKESFINGAYFIYGHTQMQSIWEMGYQSQWAHGQFKQRKNKNDFYAQAGRLIPPEIRKEMVKKHLDEKMAPNQVISKLKIFQGM